MKNLCPTVSLAAIAFILLIPLPAVSQPPTPTVDDAAVPRTPDGRPDLQGVWTGSTLTNLERPEEYAGQAFLSEEDVAALAAEKQFPPRPVDPKTGVPLTQDGVGDYNPEWFDSGITILPSKRTSLIVDPPDGRIPYQPVALEYERAYGAPHTIPMSTSTPENVVSGTGPWKWSGSATTRIIRSSRRQTMS